LWQLRRPLSPTPFATLGAIFCTDPQARAADLQTPGGNAGGLLLCWERGRPARIFTGTGETPALNYLAMCDISHALT
jgi:hypothetical protein